MTDHLPLFAPQFGGSFPPLAEGEVVLPVPGYENRYLVSNHGRVFSLNFHRSGRCVELAQNDLVDKRRTSGTRYKYVKAYYINPKTSTLVHRLVALAFIPNPNGLPQVNHKDGNKSNNYADNLEWIDGAGNVRHAAKEGLRTYPNGDKHPMAKISEDDAAEIKLRIILGERCVDIAKKMGVSIYTVYDIKRGKSWEKLPWP